MHRTHVHQLLDAHRPADTAEASAIARVRAILGETDQSVDLFDKKQATLGHFTASAIAVSPCRSKLLLIHHPAFGLWIQPGGHTDPMDASLPEAAARELEEETGIGIAGARLLGLLDVAVHEVPDGLKGLPAHLHLDLRFAFEVSTEARLGGEAQTPARWFDVAALEDVQTDDSVRAAARRLLRFGAGR